LSAARAGGRNGVQKKAKGKGKGKPKGRKSAAKKQPASLAPLPEHPMLQPPTITRANRTTVPKAPRGAHAQPLLMPPLPPIGPPMLAANALCGLAPAYDRELNPASLMSDTSATITGMLHALAQLTLQGSVCGSIIRIASRGAAQACAKAARSAAFVQLPWMQFV
jgi:hypothetical protein